MFDDILFLSSDRFDKEYAASRTSSPFTRTTHDHWDDTTKNEMKKKKKKMYPKRKTYKLLLDQVI